MLRLSPPIGSNTSKYKQVRQTITFLTISSKASAAQKGGVELLWFDEPSGINNLISKPWIPDSGRVSNTFDVRLKVRFHAPIDEQRSHSRKQIMYLSRCDSWREVADAPINPWIVAYPETQYYMQHLVYPFAGGILQELQGNSSPAWAGGNCILWLHLSNACFLATHQDR